MRREADRQSDGGVSRKESCGYSDVSHTQCPPEADALERTRDEKEIESADESHEPRCVESTRCGNGKRGKQVILDAQPETHRSRQLAPRQFAAFADTGREDDRRNREVRPERERTIRDRETCRRSVQNACRPE